MFKKRNAKIVRKKKLTKSFAGSRAITKRDYSSKSKRKMILKPAQAPAIHPNSSLIKGVLCGVRVEEIDDPLMQNIRYLDKLIDELAKGKTMEKILRQ